jgi:Icc-related predicted phosphoesterase
VLFGALGDIHGDFDALRRIMARHPEAAFWVSVGDVASDSGEYVAPPAPLYWIKGNKDNFAVIAALLRGVKGPANLHYIPNGVARRIGSLNVAALGGTLAPTWYETPAAELPVRTPRRPGGRVDDKRRHFVRAEVEACKALRGIDVFLTHEAPRPFPVKRPGPPDRGGTIDAGKTPINEALAAMRPRLHLFGHHHCFSDATRQGVRSVCLDLVSRSYLLIDGATLEYEKRDT